MIRSLALLLAATLVACASPTAVIDQRSLQCGPGQDIEVRAGLEGSSPSQEMTGSLTYLVEIANNSHEDVTVKSVRIDPSDRRAAGVESAYQAFDQTIAGGDDFLFKLPVSRTWSGGSMERSQVPRRAVEFFVTVALSNGDSYRCPFAAELR